MKTIIIYDSKYGYTAKCVDELATMLNGKVKKVNLNKLKPVDLAEYDTVIIGSPVYMGKIRKSIADFCQNYLNVLLPKKIGLFNCCLETEEKALTQLNKCFPEEIVAVAKVKEYFGGELNMKSMGLVDKMATKMIIKAAEKSGDTSVKVVESDQITITETDRIRRFAEAISRI